MYIGLDLNSYILYKYISYKRAIYYFSY